MSNRKPLKSSRQTKSEKLSQEEYEFVKIYLEDLKFRHAHFWRLLYKLVFAILFLLVVPYIFPEKIKVIKDYILFFPIAGIALSIIGGWLLGAEAYRIKYTTLKYNEIKPNIFQYKEMEGCLKIFKLSIAITTALAFFIVFTLLSIFVLCLIISM